MTQPHQSSKPPADPTAEDASMRGEETAAAAEADSRSALETADPATPDPAGVGAEHDRPLDAAFDRLAAAIDILEAKLDRRADENHDLKDAAAAARREAHAARAAATRAREEVEAAMAQVQAILAEVESGSE
ncbi:MAG: hypothetical protein AAFX08_01720 [Pseudomonadota bacterium]